MKLLNIDQNAKTIKGQKKGYMTAAMFMAPADLSGYEVCPQRSPGCTEACLNMAGRGAFPNVQRSRIEKAKMYFENRDGFMRQLDGEIRRFLKKAQNAGMTPCIRLNATSDIPWERVRMSNLDCSIIDEYSDVQFYDYTKITKRAIAHANGDMPDNYHLTFSATEDNEEAVGQVLLEGGNVSMVFSPKVPAQFEVPVWNAGAYINTRYDVIDGDETDLRFKDPRNVIVGLKAKGPARKDTSGFVRVLEQQ